MVGTVGRLFVFLISGSESLVQSYFGSCQDSYFENYLCKICELFVNCLMPVRFQGSGIRKEKGGDGEERQEKNKKRTGGKGMKPGKPGFAVFL